MIASKHPAQAKALPREGANALLVLHPPQDHTCSVNFVVIACT